MELKLKNIGMINEANVKIDGLTVIAGENDTGKSTVGKALYSSLNSIKDITRFSIEYQLYVPSGIILLHELQRVQIKLFHEGHKVDIQ